MLALHNMNYPRENTINLLQVYTSLSKKIKLENLKSSLLLKRFIFCLSTTLNSRKLRFSILKVPSLVSCRILFIQLETFSRKSFSSQHSHNKDIVTKNPKLQKHLNLKTSMKTKISNMKLYYNVFLCNLKKKIF